jgi:predicted dinucleotide-binding enzyme
MKKYKIGILGVGNIGKIVALRLAGAGHDVKVANSGDPKSVSKDVLQTGAHAHWTKDVVKDVDVLILSIPLLKMPQLKPLLSSLPESTIVIDTSNYYPGRDGHIEAMDRGQIESEWVQEQIGRPIVKAWNMILAETFDQLPHPAGHPNRLAIAVASDRDRDYEVAAELVDATGFDAYHSGPIADSWRQQPGAPAYCTEDNLQTLPAHLSSAERARLPARRDLAIAVIVERVSDGKSTISREFIANLNRAIYR